MQCPLCEEGQLTELLSSNQHQIDDKVVMVPLVYSVCSHCESEQTNADQAQRNKRAMQAACNRR